MVRSPSELFRVVSAYWMLVPSKGRLLSSGALPCRRGLRSSIEALGLLPRAPLPRTGAHLRRGAAPGGSVLAAQTESFDQRAVALHVFLLQVAQQPPTAADELEEPTLGVEVVLVLLHVFCQVRNAPAEQRNLNFRGARVAFAGGVVADDLLFDGVVEGHAGFS